MACGAGTVKAEAVANRETKHAAWAMSLLAREQVLFAMPSDGAAKKRRKKKKTAVRAVKVVFIAPTLIYNKSSL